MIMTYCCQWQHWDADLILCIRSIVTMHCRIIIFIITWPYLHFSYLWITESASNGAKSINLQNCKCVYSTATWNAINNFCQLRLFGCLTLFEHLFFISVFSICDPSRTNFMFQHCFHVDVNGSYIPCSEISINFPRRMDTTCCNPY